METGNGVDVGAVLDGPQATPNMSDTEETAPRRRRVSRKAAPSNAVESRERNTTDTVAPASMERASSPRVSHGRRARSAGSSEAAPEIAPAAPVVAGVPVEEVLDEANPASAPRTRRGRHARPATDEADRTPANTAPAENAHAPEATQLEFGAPAAWTPASAGDSVSEDAAISAARPTPTTYRFSRSRGDERPANPVDETPPPSTEVTAPSEQESASPAARGVAYQPGMPPRRRFDRANWASPETREPREGRQAAGGFEPYRRTNEPNGQRGPLPRGGRAPAPGAARGPYLPGGRGQQQAGTQGYETLPQQPPNASGNGNGAGGVPNAGGYSPYEPYNNQPGQAPYERDRMPNQGRPLRGRNYSNQPGFPNQSGYGDSRDSRGQRGPQSYRDNYRDQGSHAPYERRSSGYNNDRRGLGGRTYGHTPRESGYDRTYYTPGAPAGQESRYGNESRYGAGAGMRQQSPAALVRTVEVSGILWMNGGQGLGPAEILDGRTLLSVARMNPEDARRMGLRSGDEVRGRAEERNGRRLVVAVESVNDVRPEELRERPLFEQLTASFPNRRIRLEQGSQPISSRIIDLFSPLGFGSRALIVAPPKTGKTTLIREAAESVLKGYPDAVVMAVLVGERPEEVTDLRARLEPAGGLVYAASFDEDTQRHAWLVQVAVERAKRVAESGKDAFMVLDSLTRLARAENLASRGQGRTLSGGIDAQALDTGRRAFGAARNLEEGGSLTILATCLVDTGSRQDDVVYEEFKGTGNMELHLSRDLAQRRLFPAIDAVKSGTRREEILLTPDELRAATALRRRLADLPAQQATQQLLSVMERTPSNSALLQAIEQSGWTGSTR